MSVFPTNVTSVFNAHLPHLLSAHVCRRNSSGAPLVLALFITTISCIPPEPRRLALQPVCLLVTTPFNGTLLCGTRHFIAHRDWCRCRCHWPSAVLHAEHTLAARTVVTLLLDVIVVVAVLCVVAVLLDVFVVVLCGVAVKLL